ncbi:MAG TPA: hypothetical protein VIH57_23900 [Bacteroidales bacterium]
MKKETASVKKAFIIMPFTPEFYEYSNDIYKLAFKEEGYEAIHVAENKAVEPITEEIFSGIKDAELILCDFTNKKPNVLYELGLAHAIGKSVILIAKEGEEVPFDFHNVRVIFYNPLGKDWKQKARYDIRDSIKATNANPNPWPKPLIDPILTISDSWGKIFGTFFRVIGQKLDFPARAGFVIKFLLAVAAGVIGGLLWNLIYQKGLGGNNMEPKGIWAFLWGAITNIPLAIALIILNMVYPFSENKKLWKVLFIYLLSIGLAGWFFYDFPILHYHGFREYYVSKLLSFVATESVIVIIWSAICSIFPLIISSAFIMSRNNLLRVYRDALFMSLLIITVTSLIVIIYINALPHSPMFDTGRGIIAGVALRTMLFLGLYKVLTTVA